jgi:phosphatidylglycerophosphatase B
MQVSKADRHRRGVLRWSIRDKILLGLALACGVVFALLTIQAARGEFPTADAAVRTGLAGWRSPLLTSAMQTITMFGAMPWLLCLMGVLTLLIWVTYGSHVLLLWSGYTLPAMALFQGIRFAVGRPRPVSVASGYPSGHTVAAVALYGLLICLWWPRPGAWSWWKPAVCGGLCLLIIAVGASRLVLEKHWLSDVVGAYTAGGFYLLTCVWLLERRKTWECAGRIRRSRGSERG